MGETPKYRCAKLVASNPKRLEAVITAKGASTMYRVKGLKTYVNVMFPFFYFFYYTFAKNLRNLFFFVHMGSLLCVD